MEYLIREKMVLDLLSEYIIRFRRQFLDKVIEYPLVMIENKYIVYNL